ncbi:MAG: DJ-1/PfpI family protein [Candidatus Micrarchaeaceae archaeon]
MKVLIFLPYEDFKDETLAGVLLFLGKWKIEYALSSYRNECKGYHGAIKKITINTSDAKQQDYDAIMLIDGKGIDKLSLYEYRPLLDLVISFDRNSKFICAFGNAVKILAKANIVKGKPISVQNDNSTKSMVLTFLGIPSEKSIECAGNLCTVSSGNVIEVMPEVLARMGFS